MLSVFLLLAIVSNFDLALDGAKYAFEEKGGDFQQTNLTYQGKATAPEGVIEGFFDVQRDGDLTSKGQENGKNVINHYRAIQSDELKNSDKAPVLKLQVYNDNTKSWKVTEVTKVNKEDGTVYFLLKSEEDGSIKPNDYYTGTYQLILQ